MSSVQHLSRRVKKLLTEKAEEAAKKSSYYKRPPKKLSGPAFVQTTSLGWLKDPQGGSGSLSETAASLGIEVTSQALDERFTAEAAEMLRLVLEEAAREQVAGAAVPIELVQRFNGVHTEDSSVVALPEEYMEQWPGCGERTGGAKAALKLYVRLSLTDGLLGGPLLAEGCFSDKLSPLRALELEPGSLRIADLGFFSLQELAALDERGVYWLTRHQIQTALFDLCGQRLELEPWLARQSKDVLDVPIYLGAEQRIRARLLAVRVPSQVASQRRRELRAEAKRRGQAPSQARLALCDWTLLLSNVPVEMLSVEEALVLARARWQIELLFKLWKQHGLIDESRSQKPERRLCELYAKLLGVLVQHWCLVLGTWNQMDRSLVKAARVVRQSVALLLGALRGRLSMSKALEQIRSTLAKACRMNRRRTHPNTYQLLHDPLLNPQRPPRAQTTMESMLAA